MELRSNVPLAGLCTLELGGVAKHLIEVRTEADLVEALGFADQHDLPVSVLGGGSNVVIRDSGFSGLVLLIRTQGMHFSQVNTHLHVRVAAGENFDELVRKSVEFGAIGLECLSGIPGLVGATPIQNVGAYGQEVSETIQEVRAYDRETRREIRISNSGCNFAYRTSRFKQERNRFIVLEVNFALDLAARPKIRYSELAKALEPETEVTASVVREAVLALRRKKSMVIDGNDENRRSVGSFFMNPIVESELAERVTTIAIERGWAKGPDDVPRYPAGPGRAKLAAGWLLERSGVRKGERKGAVGVSSRHALALVHHGGGSTQALLELAESARQRVFETFGVRLELEPDLVG